jgi:hypothetical protein
MNAEDGWKLKCIFCFTETIYKPLQLKQPKRGTVKHHERKCNIILFDQGCKYCDDTNFEIMLEQTLNHSVEFCKYLQCHILLKYLTC